MSEPMRVVVRADASREIGHGHIMRCLSLAASLRKRGAEVQFFSRALEGHAFSTVGQAGFHCQPVSADTPIPPCDWLIVDHYGLDAKWESAQRGNARKILVIDDLANRQHDCDVLLDQNLNPEGPSRYLPWVPAHCQQLLGPHYALLHKNFAVERAGLQPRIGRVRRVLICFGGSDAPDATGRVVDALSEAFPHLVLDIVAGPANSHAAQLQERCVWHPLITLSVAVNDMAQRMAQADLFVGAGGSMTWERAALGLPGITLSIASNQVMLCAALAERGAGIDLGPIENFSAGSLQFQVARLIDDAPRMRDMAEKLYALCDGRGARRVSKLMMSAPG
ncbi:MAG TPA: UDP-2,4-diacetamido-2,4,6-trideoxy-beta-L-altropyranose hydrolase [Rhodocyclaceae bacterium]|nr:UDP-2,4-diacetamido-2,4,6-trideoxy-beta-L-altropyranose hydrolase [Rhodocyclaceae bacterium]